MRTKRLIIVGSPKAPLAVVISDYFVNAEWFTELEVLFYEQQMNPAGMKNLDSTMVIYAGEGGASFEAAYLMCASHKLPLIQASAEKKHPFDNPLFPYIRMVTRGSNLESQANAAFHLTEQVLLTKSLGRLQDGIHFEQFFLE